MVQGARSLKPGLFCRFALQSALVLDVAAQGRLGCTEGTPFECLPRAQTKYASLHLYHICGFPPNEPSILSVSIVSKDFAPCPASNADELSCLQCGLIQSLSHKFDWGHLLCSFGRQQAGGLSVFSVKIRLLAAATEANLNDPTLRVGIAAALGKVLLEQHVGIPYPPLHPTPPTPGGQALTAVRCDCP